MTDELVDLGFGPYIHDTPSERFPVYTRGNAGEVWPQVAYPLTVSVSRTHGDPSQLAVQATGMLTKADLAEGPSAYGGCFSGYMYLNLSLQRVLAVRSPGTSIEDSDATYLGSEGIAPPYVPAKGDRNLRCSLNAIRFGLRLLFTKELPHLAADQDLVADLKADRPDSSRATDEELVAHLRAAGELSMELFARHLLVSGQAGGAMQLLTQACEDRFGDRSLAITLMGGLGDVDSAAPSWAMWELGRRAAHSPELSRQFDRGIDGLDQRLRQDPDAAGFVAELDDFLDAFGARGPNEWEAAVDTWGTRPEMALALIDRMRISDEQRAPEVRHRRSAQRRQQVEEDALEQLGFLRRRSFARLLRVARLFTVGRERSKTTVVGAIHENRLVSRELGRRLLERGQADRVDDHWFLVADELDHYVDDPGPYRERIAQRRRTRNELARRIPPFVFDAELPPPTSWPMRSDDSPTQPPERLTAGATITGLPGCPGVAEGRARVITDPTRPGDLGPGDILIAPLTDPAWTPLFVPAEAVVVDVGGQMSHAVIVSRELGLPCVVSAADATTRIADGVRVRVDGHTGTVTVLG